MFSLVKLVRAIEILAQISRATWLFFEGVLYWVKVMIGAVIGIIFSGIKFVGTALFEIYKFALPIKITKSPDVQNATIEMSNSLLEALRLDYLIFTTVLAFSICFLIVSIVIPLSYKALSRRRLKVFVSFTRVRENIAEDLHKHLEKFGAAVLRIPFRENAVHQDIVLQTPQSIKKCDSFICLPGYAPSYVDHEVAAATISDKPIVFLISENSGTLPNTADKRYPVFRLEAVVQEQFKPLIEFLSYIGADLESTRKLCRYALCHPFMQISNALAVSVGVIGLISLWGYSFYRATLGRNLTSDAFVMLERPVELAHLALFVLLVSAAFVSSAYSVLFVRNLARQFRARNRARLKSIAAKFNRDDWIGIVPDLCPGAKMYECLFEAAPSAHHEAERKWADQGEHSAHATQVTRRTGLVLAD
jgi:hypothetical protein